MGINESVLDLLWLIDHYEIIKELKSTSRVYFTAAIYYDITVRSLCKNEGIYKREICIKTESMSVDGE